MRDYLVVCMECGSWEWVNGRRSVDWWADAHGAAEHDDGEVTRVHYEYMAVSKLAKVQR